MPKTVNKVKEIEVAAVRGNNTLAAGVDRRSVERCKEAIEKLGVIHTPVVGTTQCGDRLLLSGQSGLTALRELGVKKMAAVEVELGGDAGAKAKLALMLMSLQDRPGALCEGLLLREAVGAGVPRTEIQAMLGKSNSWITNRISLVTRLDGNVYEMVRDGILDPRSAQEVARLPEGVQFAFAEAAVREGLPKSAMEMLVAGYNDDCCPEEVKAQIIADPRSALRRMADRRRAVDAERSTPHKGRISPYTVDKCIDSLRSQISRLYHLLFNVNTADQREALKELEKELAALLAAVRGFVAPGKREVGGDAG